MGVRLKRFLGYGLTDVLTDDRGDLADPRINPASILLDLDADRADTLAGYTAYLEQLGEDHDHGLDLGALRDHRHPRRHLGDCISWHSEYGIPSVLVLQPFGCPDWARSDDMLDILSATYRRADGQTGEIARVEPIDSGPEDSALVLPHGIYPWSASYMDTRTGERVPDRIMPWIRARSAGEHDDLLAQAAGFFSHADADQHLAPDVPPDIRALADYGELFADPDTWRELRPILYSRWG